MRRTRLALGGGNGIGCGAVGGLVGGDRLLQRLQPELQLVGGQLLRPAAELVTGQPLDQQSQLTEQLCVAGAVQIGSSVHWQAM